MGKKIAIVTTFNKLDRQYSLVAVVEQQLEMLLKHGYDVRILVSEGCDRNGIYADERIEWCVVSNTDKKGNWIKWNDYSNVWKGKIHEGFWDGVETKKKEYIKYLKDVDIAICHDILFQGWFLVQNVGLRQAQKEGNLKCKFLHWTHSNPSKKPPNPEEPFDVRAKGMPNSEWVYLNKTAVREVSEMYGIPETKVRTVYNPIDPIKTFKISECAQEIIKKHKLFEPDYLTIFPSRVSPGKNAEYVVNLLGSLTTLFEVDCKVVFCTSYADRSSEQNYMKNIRKQGEKAGLPPENCIFTFEMGEAYEMGIPHEAVIDLFNISNVFIYPSKSENCSLVIEEAALTGNFLVLNKHMNCAQEFGNDMCMYVVADGIKPNGDEITVHGLVKKEYDHQAKRLRDLTKSNPMFCSRTYYRKKMNPDWIFKNQLEPLLS